MDLCPLPWYNVTSHEECDNLLLLMSRHERERFEVSGSRVCGFKSPNGCTADIRRRHALRETSRMPFSLTQTIQSSVYMCKYEARHVSAWNSHDVGVAHFGRPVYVEQTHGRKNIKCQIMKEKNSTMFIINHRILETSQPNLHTFVSTWLDGYHRVW